MVVLNLLVKMLTSMPPTKADNGVVCDILKLCRDIVVGSDDLQVERLNNSANDNDDDEIANTTTCLPDPASQASTLKFSRPSSPTSSCKSDDEEEEEYVDTLERKGFVRKVKAREDAKERERRRRVEEVKEGVRNAGREAIKRGASTRGEDLRYAQETGIGDTEDAVLYARRGMGGWLNVDFIKEAMENEGTLLHTAIAGYGGEGWRSLPRDAFDVLTSYVWSKRGVSEPSDFLVTVVAVLNNVVVPGLFMEPNVGGGGQRLQFTEHATSITVSDGNRAVQNLGKTWGSVRTNRRIRPGEVYSFAVQIVVSPKR